METVGLIAWREIQFTSFSDLSFFRVFIIKYSPDVTLSHAILFVMKNWKKWSKLERTIADEQYSVLIEIVEELEAAHTL